MASVLDVGVRKEYDNKLTSYNLSSQEEKWILSAIENHSYFQLELMGDNKIKRAFFMDASNAEDLTEMDKENYNFERRLKDEGVVKRKIRLKKFIDFWNKYLIVDLPGSSGIEYVSDKNFAKIYRCRPLGWVMEDFQSDDYGR